MKDKLFANAVAVSRTSDFIGDERFNRMIESKDLESAVKVLLESGYGGGIVLESFADFEALLEAEFAILDKLVKQSMPDEIGIECFYLFSDYHNIKVLMKALISKTDLDYLLKQGGIYSIAYLKDNIVSEHPNINKYVNDLIVESKTRLEDFSPMKFDTLIDQAMFKDINSRLLNKKTSKYIKNYFELYIDATNIINLLRAIKIDESPNFFKPIFIEGGTISLNDMEEVYKDKTRIKSLLYGTVYEDIRERAFEIDLDVFDLIKDNKLISLFAPEKYDMVSDVPAIYYYLSKMNEIKMIRFILICVKNEVPKEDIRTRLRKIYG